MTSLKVAHRLLIGFLIILVVVAGLAWLVHATSGWQANRLADLRLTALDASEHASGMAVAARNAHNGAHALLAQRAATATVPDEAAARPSERTARGIIEEGFSTFERHLARSRELATIEGRAASERVGAIESAYNSYKQSVSRFLEVDTASGVSGATMFESDLRPQFDETLAPLLARHQASTQTALAERLDAADGARQWGGRFALTGALLLLALVIGIGFVNARYVDRGLNRAVSAARAIAAGRLTNPVRVASDDEFGDLSEALNDMVARLSTATVSKTYVENIVQSMADPLVVVDPDVRIAMVNQALLDILGYEADELTGASVTRIFAHTGRQRGAAIKQDIERGLEGNVDSKFKTKAGQEVTVSLSSALVRAGGEVQGLVIVAKDITEQKRRERELIEAKEEAERMVQLRDAFLANMSHEIRTPLTGILGSAQVLAEVVQGEHRNLASIIEDAGHRLLDTINSVLEMARIEAGEVQPEMEILDFAEEAEAVANVLRPVAQKKGLVLRVYPPTDGRVAAQIDRSCLNRILNNLVGNAIKFTREGAVSIEVSTDGDDAVLTVRDTGIGIAKEFVPFLFDDFKQESTGLRRSHEGSGLGLAITKKLVDMMGGTIEVESVKGLGSAFSVRFDRVPVEEAEAAQLAPPLAHAATDHAPQPWEEDLGGVEPTFGPPPPAGERPGRHLLLIEDNQQNAYMAKFMLDGYAADIATTPDEAIELARRFQYGVLLVDINLGTDSSGIDLLHDFRKLEGYDETPAVAVTAYALPGDRERFLSEGFSDYVSKPYRKETLRDAVERALASSKPSATVADLDVVLGGSFDEQEGVDSADFTDAAPPDDAPATAPSEAHTSDPLPMEMTAGAPHPDAPIPSGPPPHQSAPAADPSVDRERFEPAPQPTSAPPSPAPHPQTASPDEFLPSTYRPDVGAFPPEVARIVQEAADQRVAQQQALRTEAAQKRTAGPRPESAPLAGGSTDDGTFHFVDIQPPGTAGDGAGRPAEDPRG